VRLTEVEGGTQLDYSAEAKVGGKLAQLGARLIDGFAKKQADTFFATFKTMVEGPPAEAEPEAAQPEPAAEAQAPDAQAAGSEEPQEKKGFWKKLIG
jgi:hypothetical protein